MLFPEFLELLIVRLLSCTNKKAVLILEKCFEIRMPSVYSIITFDWPREVLFAFG
jgi:hypothetical protein